MRLITMALALACVGYSYSQKMVKLQANIGAAFQSSGMPTPNSSAKSVNAASVGASTVKGPVIY